MPSVNIYLYLSPGLKFLTYTMYHVMWLGWMTSSSFVPLQTVLAPCSFVQSLDKLIYSEALPLVELRQTPTKLQSSSGLCQFFGCLRRRGGLKPYLAGVAADPASDRPATGGGAPDLPKGHPTVAARAGAGPPVLTIPSNTTLHPALEFLPSKRDRPGGVKKRSFIRLYPQTHDMLSKSRVSDFEGMQQV